MGEPEDTDRGRPVAPPATSPSAERAERLELYKLAVEMADRVSARRGSANAFFLTLNTALVGLTGLSAASSPEAALVTVRGVTVPLLALTGLVLAAAWWLLLRSYRDLNEAKFKVINEIEAGFSVHPFADEWKSLKKDPVKPWRQRYAELATVEQVVPAAFAVLYLVLGAHAWWP